MKEIDRIILNTLYVNMGYRRGETVGVVMQEWAPHLGEDMKDKFDAAAVLCRRMVEVMKAAGVDVSLFHYVPAEPRNGVDASEELYEMCGGLDVLFMPTVFSLTHTAFRKAMTARNTRIASMPGFTMSMFEPDGPMDIDYRELAEETEKVAAFVKLCGKLSLDGWGTSMRVEIVPETVHASTGMLDKPGAFGNLPGAEVYALPRENGNTKGYFTVPRGWGGPMPLPFPVRFWIEGSRFVRVDPEYTRQQRWVEEHVKPLIFGQENFDVFAELGIGTNPNLNRAYIKKHGWSILTAEKISGSVHFANGNNTGFGGTNDVPVHIDWVAPGVRYSGFDVLV